MEFFGTHPRHTPTVRSGPAGRTELPLWAEFPWSISMGAVDVKTVRPPPIDFDRFVVWLGELGDRLVLLDEIPLDTVRQSMRRAQARIERHVRHEPPLDPRARPTDRLRELGELVRSDHRWFETSLEELAGLLRVVETEDHGGHRQALGQYGRLLAAALAHHRAAEAELEREVRASGTLPL